MAVDNRVQFLSVFKARSDPRNVKNYASSTTVMGQNPVVKRHKISPDQGPYKFYSFSTPVLRTDDSIVTIQIATSRTERVGLF